MAQVRGSASVTAMLLVLCILLHYKIAVAAKYTVGDDAGWHFNIQSWPTGKKFLANDTLVFNYSTGSHSVVVVDENGFTTCTASGQIFTSGKDEIKLKKGMNYFICGVGRHCADHGMKMAISAA
ncbi:hypothetical protein M0R45_026595 [Rubus argutus]|uniref:Basic blue protein n=1 Tax=Rubus argutus TaxID=59490 RepID=A0AAW1WYF6_RUBAR